MVGATNGRAAILSCMAFWIASYPDGWRDRSKDGDVVRRLDHHDVLSHMLQKFMTIDDATNCFYNGSYRNIETLISREAASAANLHSLVRISSDNAVANIGWQTVFPLEPTVLHDYYGRRHDDYTLTIGFPPPLRAVIWIPP